MSKYRIAIVGSGGAGLTAAFLLHKKHDVYIYEKENHFGGHAHTLSVVEADNKKINLDVGFMVMNSHNYTKFYKLLERLNIVEFGSSEMSFGYSNLTEDISYAINWQVNDHFSTQLKMNDGLFDKNNYLNDLLPHILKFIHKAKAFLSTSEQDPISLHDFMEQAKINEKLKKYYIIPIGAAIWSTPFNEMLKFPAKNFLQFFYNHGLLELDRGLAWQHIQGGSRTYVDAIVEKIGNNAKLNAHITSVKRNADNVELNFASGEKEKFDKVILACHADEALQLLIDPTNQEQALLSSWSYATNSAILHCDPSLMPTNKTTWASWNFISTKSDDSNLCCTYHLNRLQGHTTAQKDYFLTLNPPYKPADDKIIKQLLFKHPTYSLAAFKAQDLLKKINGLNNSYFCGSYLGFGFHEDAVRSGLNVAEDLGCTL